VGSLVEEKNSLLKRVQSLEKENKTLQEKITQLTDNNNRNHENSQSTEKNPASLVLDQSVIVVNQEEFDANETAPIANNSEVGNEDNTSSTTSDKPVETQRFDFVMLSDSNRRYIDVSKLCSNRTLPEIWDILLPL
jgi:uncharacterized protein (DUF3084 family)